MIGLTIPSMEDVDPWAVRVARVRNLLLKKLAIVQCFRARMVGWTGSDHHRERCSPQLYGWLNRRSDRQR